MNQAFNYFFQTTFKHNEMFTDYQLDSEQQKNSKEVFVIAILSYVVLQVIILPLYYSGIYFLEFFGQTIVPCAASLLIGFLIKITGVFIAIQVLTKEKIDLFNALGLIGMTFLPMLMATLLATVIPAAYSYIIFAGYAGSAFLLGHGFRILYSLPLQNAMIAAFAVCLAHYLLMDYVYRFIWGGF